MASILICHAAQDVGAAKELGSAFEKAGFRVWYVGDVANEPDWLSSLYVYDGVIVLWSKSSIALPELHEIARAALIANRLIPVREEDCPVEAIPAEFRKLFAPLTGDIAGIRRRLGQLRPPSPPPEGPRRAGASERAAPDIGAAEPRRNPFDNLDIGSGAGAYRRQRPEGIGAASEPRRFPLAPSRTGPGSAADSRPGIVGVGAASGVSEPRPSAAIEPQQKALAVEAGRLVHKIPQKMWVGEQETVEVRLGRALAEGLAHGLVGRGALSSQDIPILETMSVSLYAKGGTFDIERHSETTQLISGGEQLKGTQFEQADYGRWIWLVTPRKSGSHMLFVRVSASLKDSRGLPTSASLPDREFPVSVSVHAGKVSLRILRSGLLAAGGAAGAALIGAATQDLWWPKLKLLLQSWGWLG